MSHLDFDKMIPTYQKVYFSPQTNKILMKFLNFLNKISDKTKNLLKLNNNCFLKCIWSQVGNTK